MFVIGRILKAHGVRGDVKVQPITSDVTRFRRLKSVYLGPEYSAEEEAGEPVKIKKVKYLSGDKFVILTLEGITDRDTAESLKGVFVQVSEKDAIVLREGEYFFHDLVGLKVIDEHGAEAGMVKEILETGSNEVLVVRGPGGEYLVPFIVDAGCDVDLEAGTITIQSAYMVY